MPIRSSKAWALALLMGAASLAQAHTDEHEAIPDVPGARVSAALAATSLSASTRLPSQALPGYLMLGDAGVDHRGFALEHGSVSLGYRLTPTWGAELALGAHGSDPIHVEAVWLQAKGLYGGADWRFGAGRQSPSLGAVMGQAGHLDRFSLMPLAKQAVSNGDWIEDGLELGLKHPIGDADGSLDIGLWSGRLFPGAVPGAAAPSLHAGLTWDSDEAGDLSLDAFAAQLRPAGRGSRASSLSGGHSHSPPSCDASLTQVVCFDGRSRIAGLSVQWQAPSWPLTLTGAVMWRKERGTLQSRDGEGQYSARNRGDWMQASWRFGVPWELGLRHERLMAVQSLTGAGASLVANEAGLGSYAPLRRSAAMLGWNINSWSDLRLEAGRETAGPQAARFVALRLLLRWGQSLAFHSP